MRGIDEPMERFYFDVYNTEHSQVDGKGQLLPGREHAGLEAMRILRDVAYDEMPGGDHLKITVKVRNARREQIFVASLTLNSSWT